MNSDFEPPPKTLSILATVGGVLTAIAAIAGLEWYSRQMPRNTTANQQAQTQQISQLKGVDKIDYQNMQLPGQPVSSAELASAKTPYIPSQTKTGSLSAQELAMAKTAWAYFQTNWNEQTGLVNSVDGFASVTMWDQAAAMAALVSAKELGLITTKEFETKMSRSLRTLAKLPLYNKELPNKVYNPKTLIPVNYGQVDKREEIGWSAIDLGRLAIWLKIVGAKYPQFRNQTEAVWKSWKVDRLVKDGEMYGTSVVNGKEQYNQEGRLGYGNYAAYGLKLWGLDVAQALDYTTNTNFVNLYGHGVPYDKRNLENSGANNYVLSEPFILDGIETGFQSLPKPFADRVLAAQEARYKATNKLTALTEDNLDREPYFVYGTIFVNGQPWATINEKGKNFNNLRFMSTKAAVGWHVLYNTEYTQTLFNFVSKNLSSNKGLYGGYYESLNQPNQSLTANNNGIVLQELLYKKIGQPFTVWAGVKVPR